MRLLRRLRYWLDRRRLDAELAEELEFHRSMLASSGAPAVAMGNVTLAREEARAVWIWPWLESIWQDAVFAWRGMRRAPAFSLTALFALGAAIGLNTSLFTIFNALTLRPWAVPDAGRMAMVYAMRKEGPGGLGIAQARYLQQHSTTLSGLIAMQNGERVKLEGRAQQLTFVSGNYFRVLGVEMARGRGFLEEEDRADAPQAVGVISFDVWQNELGADPSIPGRSIRIDDIPFTVVGVAPAGFTGTNPLRNGVWIPLAARRLLRPGDPSVLPWLTNPNFCCTVAGGRLAPGVTRAQAEAELGVLLEHFHAANHLAGSAPTALLTGTSWMDSPRKKRQVIPVIALLFSAVTLVLLLACANVGNLLLARAAARGQEIAVRLSLGGSRRRIVRQLLVESMLLACGAAVIGFLVALVVPAAVVHRLADGQNFEVGPDWTVLAYTAGISVLSCLAFGLAPALHGTRRGIAAALKSGTPLTAPRLRLRGVLLAVQVAVSIVLLANAGMLVRATERTELLDPGFDVEHVMVLSVDLPSAQYAGPKLQALIRDLVAQIDGAAGLPPSAVVLNPPLSNANYSTDFRSEPGAPTLHIYWNEVSPGYFDAVRMRLVDGRNFTAADVGRDVLIVNQAAVRRWWPASSPIGRAVYANGKMREIVGVVSDTYTNDLSGIEAVLYVPLGGLAAPPSIVVRDHSPAALDRIASLVKQVEPRAEVHAEPLTARFQARLQSSIYGAEFAAFLGFLALVIASVGISGVFAYNVGQRTREIGVRMALGATPVQAIRLIVRSSATALLTGAMVGLAGAVALSKLLSRTLPGVEPADPLAYANVVLLFAAAIAIATAAPARRAARIDPVRALRWE